MERRGHYAAALAPWILTLCVATPLGVLWGVLEKQREALIFNVCLLAARLGALASGAHFFGEAVPTLALYAVVGVTFHLFLIAFFSRLTGVRLAVVGTMVARWAALAVACAALPWSTQRFVSASPEWVLGAVVAQAALYGLGVLAFDAELRGIATRWLRRPRP